MLPTDPRFQELIKNRELFYFTSFWYSKYENDNLIRVLKYLGIYWEYEDIKSYTENKNNQAKKTTKNSYAVFPLSTIIRPEIIDVVKKTVKAPSKATEGIGPNKNGIIDTGTLSSAEFQAAMHKYMKKVEKSNIPNNIPSQQG